MPGVGFDVVPSDCLAAALKRALPAAVRLELAIAWRGSASRGTTKTSIESLGALGRVREARRLVEVPAAYRTRTVPFRDHPRFAMSIPWGDVSTAFTSTGIPDIVVYAAAPRVVAEALRLARPLMPFLGHAAVRKALTAAVEAAMKRVPGPDAAARAHGEAQVWGRVEDPSGGAVEGTVVTPEGYTHTVDAAWASALGVLAGGVAPGYHTPSTAFGPDFVTTLPGCDLIVEPPRPIASSVTSPG
jgi:short subunit dehydrogenase-like uncharacterized protein